MSLKFFWCILILSTPGFAQRDKVYTSLEEALQNKEMVYQLDITGAQRSPFSESICELSKLEVLIAGFKHLEELPECIGDLTNLRVLNLWTSDLDSLPESLSRLQHLTTLILGYNKFRVFPAVIRRIPNLQHLEMPGNSLKTLPDSMSDMIHLEHLDLSFNLFTGFPVGLTTLPALDFLDLGYNNVVTLPLEFASMKGLGTCILVENEIVQLPANLAQMQGLGTLDLSNNFLEGVPESIACWNDHGKINFDYNRFYCFSTFVIVDANRNTRSEIFFGSLEFLADSVCAGLDLLFDSLGVMRLENAVALIQKEDVKIDSATLFLPGATSPPEWELVTRPDYDYPPGNRQYYYMNWKVIKMDAATGLILDATNHRKKLYYGPEPY